LRAPAVAQSELDMIAFLAANDPALVVISDGNCMPPVSVLEFCVSRNLRFVTIGHMTSEYFGIDDVWAERYRTLMPLAQCCYFVSRTNLKVFERQIGRTLPNSAIVLNPFNVDYSARAPWPSQFGEELRFAHVGRLHPPSKGQDILLEALSQPQWRDRSWHLTLYGDGSMREVVEKLIDAFGLSQHVTLQGFVDSIERVWAENHCLVMPSRYEGLPLAIIEAMLCGRPVLATDVGGHAEIIEDGVTGFIAGGANFHSVSAALERLWDRRGHLEIMGEDAARAIRTHVPLDPVSLFVSQIKKHAFINS
jgi:glycosyltransferase involved in cell wall biosynthesis